MPAAVSNYRQVRLTITEEAGSRITVRVLVKPLQAAWSEKHVVWVHSWRTERRLTHWTHLVALALRAILEERLPED